MRAASGIRPVVGVRRTDDLRRHALLPIMRLPGTAKAGMRALCAVGTPPVFVGHGLDLGDRVGSYSAAVVATPTWSVDVIGAIGVPLAS